MNTCNDCKFYEELTPHVGGCSKINAHVMIQNDIAEAADFASQNKLIVRKEFGCNLYEK